MCVCIYIYIYIYIERERERDIITFPPPGQALGALQGQGTRRPSLRRSLTLTRDACGVS